MPDSLASAVISRSFVASSSSFSITSSSEKSVSSCSASSSTFLRLAISSSFDRSQESSADLFALKTLEKAEISPRYVSTVFRRLKEEHGDYNENLEFLMSHPNINKRIKESLEYELTEDFENQPFEIDWEAVKRNL